VYGDQGGARELLHRSVPEEGRDMVGAVVRRKDESGMKFC
jgi:hypothetical protein